MQGGIFYTFYGVGEVLQMSLRPASHSSKLQMDTSTGSGPAAQFTGQVCSLRGLTGTLLFARAFRYNAISPSMSTD